MFGLLNPAGLASGRKLFIALDAGLTPVVGTFNGLLPGATVAEGLRGQLHG